MHCGHPTSAKLIAFCASTTLLFLLFAGPPTPNQRGGANKENRSEWREDLPGPRWNTR